MLSDGTLRGLKPQAALYKVADRDGLYLVVTPRGTISFRMDYRLNGRRETLTIGRYGSKDGISLLMARERCMEARKAIAQGISPAQEKQREKSRQAEAQTFGEYTKRWLAEHRMADSTKAMRKTVIDRDILPVFQNRRMAEIGPEDLRALCAKIKGRGAPPRPSSRAESSSSCSPSRLCTARRRRTLLTRLGPHRSRPSCRRIGRCCPPRSD